MINMRRIRRQRGLTLKELGKMVGMAESTISLYEKGRHDPDLETFQRIADALHVSTDELLGREPQKAADQGGMREAVMRLHDEIDGLTDDESDLVLALVEKIKGARKPL